jgi:hypothetical protein
MSIGGPEVGMSRNALPDLVRWPGLAPGPHYFQ